MTGPATARAIAPVAPNEDLAALLVDQLGEQGARRRFAEAPGWLRLARALRPRAQPPVPLELVRLPVVVASARRGGAVERLYVVERVLGHAWAIAFGRATADATAEEPALSALPARLAIGDCKKPLDAFAARAAFAFGRGRMRQVPELGVLEAASYPFWLCYRRRAAGIDFGALDAVTGARPGSALRAAIAAALIDAEVGGGDGDR